VNRSALRLASPHDALSAVDFSLLPPSRQCTEAIVDRLAAFATMSVAAHSASAKSACRRAVVTVNIDHIGERHGFACHRSAKKLAKDVVDCSRLDSKSRVALHL
jgi:hypothetical protein